MSDKCKLSRLSTGNEFISIPDITASTAGIEDAGFMHTGFRACIELQGSDSCPFIKPVLEVDGKDLIAGNAQSEQVSYWIPRFTASAPTISAEYLIFAPLDRRGFVCLLTVENTSQGSVTVKAGAKGCWESTLHTANHSKRMSGVKHAIVSPVGGGVPIIEFRGNVPILALALVSQEPMPSRVYDGGSRNGDVDSVDEGPCTVAETPVYYELIDEYVLGPSEKKVLPFYVAIGLEEVSAIASAQELRLQGW